MRTKLLIVEDTDLDRELPERALKAGCNDFVSKPIDDLALVDMVRRLVEQQ